LNFSGSRVSAFNWEDAGRAHFSIVKNKTTVKASSVLLSICKTVPEKGERALSLITLMSLSRIILTLVMWKGFIRTPIALVHAIGPK